MVTLRKIKLLGRKEFTSVSNFFKIVCSVENSFTATGCPWRVAANVEIDSHRLLPLNTKVMDP